jgi:hypothetical protein
MKKSIAIVLFTVFSVSLMAQETMRVSADDDQEIKTIFKKEKRDGFYGAVSVGYSPIDKKDGLTLSSRGCWIMDHIFAIGVGGSAFINELDELPIDINLHSDNDKNLTGGYGGIVVEPIVMPLKPIHLSFPILLGVGAAGSFTNYTYFSTYAIDDFFFVIEPQAELELNINRWMRLALFAGYRYTTDIDIEGISKDALRGYSAGLTVKMGLF